MSEGVLRVTSLDTPLGELTVALSSEGVVATAFDDEEPEHAIAGLEERLGLTARSAVRGMATIRREVEAYFDGRARTFSTPPRPAIDGRRVPSSRLGGHRVDPLTASCGPMAMSPPWRATRARHGRRHAAQPQPDGALVPATASSMPAAPWVATGATKPQTLAPQS